MGRGWTPRTKSFKKVSFTQKKLFKIDDIDSNKILVSKKNHMAQISQLNFSMDIVAIMLLDLYA